MSFVGAIATQVRQVLANYSKEIKLPCLLVGAGNFTVASVLRSGGYHGSIKSCDVSLYTSALGAYLSDQAITISEKTDCPDHLKGLLSTKSPLETAASIALLLDLREVWQLKNPYQEKLFHTSKDNWPNFMDETKQRLETYKKHIGAIEYAAMDGFQFLKNHDPNHTAFAFPPTYKRGYERLEKLLRAVVSWDPPEYRDMTDVSLELYELVAGFKSWFVVLEKDLPEVYAILDQPAAVLPRGSAKYTYILAKKPSKKFVVKKTIKSETTGPAWPPDRAVTGDENLTFAKITLAQSMRLNELYLSSHIDYSAGATGATLGFFLDGRIFGKVDFVLSTHQWKLPEKKPMIYIMSDLAVASSVKKFAKLVLLCLLSKEVKEIIDLKYCENFGYAVTTAFSKFPASMKYRGIFKLHTRKEIENGYMLNYYAPFMDHTIKQALEIWRKKYGK